MKPEVTIKLADGTVKALPLLWSEAKQQFEAPIPAGAMVLMPAQAHGIPAMTVEFGTTDSHKPAPNAPTLRL